MLLKSLEFKRLDGQKVKVTEIPFISEGEPYYFFISSKLEVMMRQIFLSKEKKNKYSFRDYLKRTAKWNDYQAVFSPVLLKNNA
ncbi:DUF2535 family protein [Bacillus gobiensis]|uniref:DUF2535 family protein n=1 Tax=Bacillus gobiensis TaxID=1441095 RepID=UPI003D2114F5